MFIDSGKDMNRQERIHVDTRCGTIESSTATTKQRVFDICLEDPFSIEVEKIYVTIERGNNGTYRWKRTIPAHCQLNVEIKCLHHSDAVHLLGLMEKKSASKYRGSLTEEDATLRATWYELPECPPAGKLLAMTRTDGPESSIKMKFGVELSMGWSRKKDSPLAAFAKQRRAALVPDQIQLPTPSASDESENIPKQQYIVTWIFMNSRFHKMKSLKCPLCATAPSARAQHEFSSFDRLHTHVMMWHDHFQPRVELTGYDNTGVATRRYTIHLSLSTAPTEKMTQPKYKGEEDHWIAPEVPFDEQAYLRGEDTWTGHVRKVERADRPQISAAKKQPSSGSGSIKPKVRPVLSDIKDLPDLPKTKWPLPKVPRVRFYRTKSKRPFEPDENISESDESVDENWLQAHKRDEMISLPISAGGSDFYQDWNRAATEDDFPADLFTRECLVRFTRNHRGKMWDDEYYAEFIKTVNRLHELKLIDSEVQSYCSDRRSLVSGVPEKAVNGRYSQTDRNGKQRATSNGQSGEAAKTCSCGSPVMSARGVVTCDDIVSIPLGRSVTSSFWHLLTSLTALLASAVSHGVRGTYTTPRELAMRGLLDEDGYQHVNVRASVAQRSRSVTGIVLMKGGLYTVCFSEAFGELWVGLLLFGFVFVQAVWWRRVEQLGRGASSVQARW
jgi:hypothetical protein